CVLKFVRLFIGPLPSINWQRNVLQIIPIEPYCRAAFAQRLIDSGCSALLGAKLTQTIKSDCRRAHCRPLSVAFGQDLVCQQTELAFKCNSQHFFVLTSVNFKFSPTISKYVFALQYHP